MTTPHDAVVHVVSEYLHEQSGGFVWFWSEKDALDYFNTAKRCWAGDLNIYIRLVLNVPIPDALINGDPKTITDYVDANIDLVEFGSERTLPAEKVYVGVRGRTEPLTVS